MASENRLINAVHSVTRVLSSSLDEEERLRRMLQVAMDAVDATGGSILLHEPKSHQLQFRHVIGEKASELIGFAIGDSEGIAGQVFQTCKAQVSNNANQNPQHSRRVDKNLKYETRNLVTVPICYPGGQAVGIMQLINKSEGDFTDEDLTVLDIVGSISAMSIQNADLARQAEKSAVLHYLGDLAHDIKNKTAPIIMGTQTLEPMLQDTFERLIGDAVSRDEAELMLADITELLKMVSINAEDLNRYTQFIANTIKGKPIEPRLDPDDLIDAARRQLDALEPTARKYSVALERNFTESLQCKFDRFLIERAVYNLVNNALPETPAGGSVKVSVWQDDRFAVLEVRDTGRGMPRHILDSILVGNATSTKPGGTGLGTMIVKKVAEVHHGVFEGESEENVGTAFRIKLPLA